jgi:hypothetical protein
LLTLSTNAPIPRMDPFALEYAHAQQISNEKS